jgi:hypothetical protein
MPLGYRIDPELGLIYYAGAGTVQGQEMLQVELAVSRDPMRKPSMKIIADFTGIDLDYGIDDLRALLRMNRTRVHNGSELEPTAFISHSRVAGIAAETLRFLGDDLPLKFSVFTTLPDALKWLGLADSKDRITEIEQELKQTLRQTKGGG